VSCGRLDFAEAPGAETYPVEIASVHHVHPNWRFAFLSLRHDVPADRVLEIATPEMRDSLDDRERLIDLQKLLVKHSLHASTVVLFSNLPEVLVAELAEVPRPQDRLFGALASLNRKLYLVEGALPIETVLDTTETLSFDLQHNRALTPCRQEAEQVRAALTGVSDG
jgi:hypothetical protein